MYIFFHMALRFALRSLERAVSFSTSAKQSLFPASFFFFSPLCNDLCIFSQLGLWLTASSQTGHLSAVTQTPMCFHPTARPQGPFYLCHNSFQGMYVTEGLPCGSRAQSHALPCLLTPQPNWTWALTAWHRAPNIHSIPSSLRSCWSEFLFGFCWDFSELKLLLKLMGSSEKLHVSLTHESTFGMSDPTGLLLSSCVGTGGCRQFHSI